MDTIEELERDLRQRRRVIDARLGEARSALRRAEALEAEVAALEADTAEWDRVTALLNSLGEERQIRAQETIETLVTRGLQVVFDDEQLSFHILQTTRGKAAVADFVVRTTRSGSDVIETPVLDARGGGMAAVIGFLLRIVVMLLTGRESLLVLDETFGMVSEDYLPALGEFLRELVEKTGIQVLLVTHQPEFLDFADKAYRFSQVEGRTVVSEHG